MTTALATGMLLPFLSTPLTITITSRAATGSVDLAGLSLPAGLVLVVFLESLSVARYPSSAVKDETPGL